MSGQGEMMFPLDITDIKTEIKQEYGGDPAPKKTRGRKKGSKNQKQTTITDSMPIRKKRDRFNGMPEEEVVKRVLPDHLAPDLDIVIVGINPGLCAAYVGHHYAGPGNHFWKCMFLSGLIPEQLNAYDDFKLLNYGIGFTNIVARTTRGSADLSRKEIKEGAGILTEKLKKFKPKIAVFNGKGIYEVFVGHKNFAIGKQPDLLPGTETTVYVMPSSSARCSQLPRAVDKVPFYASLKKLRDYLRGDLKELDDSEVCFPDLELKVVKREPKQEIKEEPDSSCAMQGIPFSQGYPPTNLHIKQEPVYNQSQYGMSANQNSYPVPNLSQQSSYNNSQPIPSSYQNNSALPNHSQLSSYNDSQPNSSSSQNNCQMMTHHSGGDNSHNFRMVQNSMGDNSFQMSQVMMQGQQQAQNFQMFQGSVQSYSGNTPAQTVSFQQNIQMSGLNGQSGPVMVQSSFQCQGSQFSTGAQNFQSSGNYQQNAVGQGNYMNYQNQHYQNYEQSNTNSNQEMPRNHYSNDVTFMGFSQGQGQSCESQYSQYCQPSSNFVKQEPKDFTETQNGCNRQSENSYPAYQNPGSQGHNNVQIKEEPKEYGDFSNSSCQNRK